jgi:putative ABC transport system permease protein
VIARLRALWNSIFRRDQLNHDLDEELSTYVELVSAEKLRLGISPDEAYRDTRREMGGADQVKQRVRDVWTGVSLERLGQDIRYAARTLAKRPAFTFIAVMTLALGVGASAAIFSVVNAVLLRPLPYSDPSQLVDMSENQPKEGIAGVGMSWPAFTILHDGNRSFSAIAGIANHALTLTGWGEPADVSTVAVTPDFFTLFGTVPLLGRGLVADDGSENAAPVVVLSEDLWRNRMGADPNIVGRAVTLDQRGYTVAGVMPASFRTPFVGQNEQMWIPLAQDPLFRFWRTRPPQTHWLALIARMRPGVSIAQAQSELKAVSSALERRFPEERGWQLRIKPLQQVIDGDVKTPLLMLLSAVGLLLLIACVNIANLLLARAIGRAKEMALRLALGASLRRIAGQLLVESVLLGLVGGTTGILLAWVSVSVFRSAVPAAVPQYHPIHLDLTVLGASLALTVVASLAFGLAPMLYTVRSNPQTSLRDGSRAGEDRGAQHARNFLAAAEVAVAVVLLVGAGLLLRSFAHLLAVNPGFETEHLVKAEVSLPRYQYATPAQWRAFADQLMTRLEAEHGMEKSAIGLPLPIVDNQVNLPFSISGNPPLPPGKSDTADYVSASPKYFSVMGISLIRGRLFSQDDTTMTPPVALINEALARRYFPHQNPLGRQLVFGFPPNGNVSREIVGVVADIHNVSLAKEPGPMMYVPFEQEPFWGAEIVVHSTLNPEDVEAAVRAQTHNIDPGLPVTEVETLPEALRSSVAEPRFRTLLLAIFGAIALLLATVGIYGVISYSVSRRTREIGVRIALGAARAHLWRLVIAESAKLALFGLTAGIPAALLLTRFLSILLFAVRPADPPTFIGVAVLLTLVAFAAGCFPARRAMRVDAMTALRCE